MLFFKVTVPFHASENSYCPVALLFEGQTLLAKFLSVYFKSICQLSG